MLGDSQERRIALVIGNAAYEFAAALDNPTTEALHMADVLERLRFAVDVKTDCDINDLDNNLRAFARKLAGADVGLLYYSGHAIQYNGENYLIPVDARLEEPEDLERRAFSLSAQIAEMRRTARTSLIFLDACRDDPFRFDQASAGSRAVVVRRTGLKEVEKETLKDALVVFSAEQGHIAVDGEKGGMSPFTSAVLEHIEEPGLEVTEMMRRVRRSVRIATQGKQNPWSNESLTAPFYFNPSLTDARPATASRSASTDMSAQPGIHLASSSPAVAAPSSAPLPDAGSPASVSNDSASSDFQPKGVADEARILKDEENGVNLWRWAPFITALLLVLFIVVGRDIFPTDPPEDKATPLIYRLSALDDAVEKDTVVFLADVSTPLDQKRRVLHAVVAMAQYQIFVVKAGASIPGTCRAPVAARPLDADVTLICAGLDAQGQNRLLGILAAVPDALWREPDLEGERKLAMLAVADFAAQQRASGATAQKPQFVALKDALNVGSRFQVPVTMAFAGTFSRSNAQVIGDRLVSFGWNLKVDRNSDAIGLNVVRFGGVMSEMMAAYPLVKDMDLQGLKMTMERIKGASEREQVDIFISTPLSTWNNTMPQFAWCYQEFDSAKDGTQQPPYLLACHPSKPACLDARGSIASAKKLSSCTFQEGVSSVVKLSPGGRADSWFARANAAFPLPLPALPQ